MYVVMLTLCRRGADIAAHKRVFGSTRSQSDGDGLSELADAQVDQLTERENGHLRA